MKVQTKILAFLMLLSAFTFIPCVYANDDEGFDLALVPNMLADYLHIDLFASHTLIAVIALCMTMFPTLVLTRNPIAHAIMGIATLSCLLALGWVPPFVLVIVVLMVVVLLGGKMRDWVGGPGGGD